MCTTCGCETNGKGVRVVKLKKYQDPHHHHDHDHSHEHHHHDHKHDSTDTKEETHNQKIIQLEQDILQKNNLLAERNRGYIEAKNILALNLVSSPGSGKTALLERTIYDLQKEVSIAVIEGDQQTNQDAERIAKTGASVVQINTGKGCHLDAEMVNKALRELKPESNSILMIENVGNLVCPAMFDLGETARVVIISVTEGDDKPIKYPDMFQSAHICLINKIDLLPYVNFSVERAKDFARKVNHHLQFMEVSATTGEGMVQWYDWLKSKVQAEVLV
ncbi:MAG: hydrogenase nickel incorporation protein HypB [Microscillaceae bacterium]|jgi:hydrogenase nickel incorporation protein HypB|nr:hydrogenase nickel incorporation protein HypB [Microscillaceae bacterium]